MRPGNDYSGEWYLPVGNGDHHLYVLERGTGPAVLAVHGGPGHDHGYLLDALAYIEGHHTVVYFDQRGSLRSPMPLSLVSFDAVIDDFTTLVAELGAPVPVVAHSMGCLLLAAALARHPTLFAEVLLVCPAPLRSAQPWPEAPLPDRRSTLSSPDGASAISHRRPGSRHGRGGSALPASTSFTWSGGHRERGGKSSTSSTSATR